MYDKLDRRIIYLYKDTIIIACQEWFFDLKLLKSEITESRKILCKLLTDGYREYNFDEFFSTMYLYQTYLYRSIITTVKKCWKFIDVLGIDLKI